MKHDFHERKANRIENAENQSAKNAAASTTFYLRSKEMSSVIPMEQPILVGHHSEGRDRRYRDKIWNTMGKSVEAQKKAGYYADKAEAIKNNDAIFADDPDAIEKLEAKLKDLQAAQDFMKSANKCIRNQDREAFLKLPMATAATWDELTQPKRFGGMGFAGFSLTNNNANIRRIKQRIYELKAQEVKPAIDKEINNVRVYENREANRLQLIFPGKPPGEIIAKLKGHGFRWCRSEQAWQRHISPSAIYWGIDIAQRYTY